MQKSTVYMIPKERKNEYLSRKENLNTFIKDNKEKIVKE